MTTIKRSADIEPLHPGSVLREEFLPEAGLSVAQAAARMGVSRQMLHAIISGRSAISPDMAIRLSRLIDSSPAVWLALQNDYDVWHIERARAAEFAKIKSAAA
jgi:addiction module HigA family antidote